MINDLEKKLKELQRDSTIQGMNNIIAAIVSSEKEQWRANEIIHLIEISKMVFMNQYNKGVKDE